MDELSSLPLKGSVWSVEYFSRATAEDTVLSPLDTSLPDNEASYNQIVNLPIYLTTSMAETDLSSSSAYVRNITPQQGDMFVGTLLNGRMVMFVVNEAKRLGHNLIPIYEITFSLDVYLDFGFENERYRDLLSKVKQKFT